MLQLRLDSIANNLSEIQRFGDQSLLRIRLTKDYRLTDISSTQTYVAHKLEHQRFNNAYSTRTRLDGLPLRALRVILEYSTVLGRLAIFHANRALRAAVHANKDVFADLSLQNEYRESLHPTTLSCLLNYTDVPLKLAINLPLRSPVVHHDDVLQIYQPHLTRTQSLHLGDYWDDARYREDEDEDQVTDRIEWREAQMSAIWHSICSFLMEPAPQLKRTCIESGLFLLCVDLGPLILPADLFSSIAPSLRGLRLVEAFLPVQHVLAFNRIQDFSYLPQSMTLNAADLRNILKMMPELQTLELYIFNFEPDTVDTPYPIGVSVVPLRVFRLGHICSNLDKILSQIHAAAKPNLRIVTLYDDSGDYEPNQFQLDSVLAVYQRILRICMIKHEIEFDLATDNAQEQVVTMRLFISESYGQFEDSVPLLLSASRTVSSSLAWLTSLTMHEFFWPCDLTAGGMDGWYSRLPALTDAELVLGAPDDYARMCMQERVTVMLADDIMGGMSMPQLARLTLSHRVRGPQECNYVVTKCTCEQLLSVSLADLFDLAETLRPKSRRLEALILRGLDPVDLDLDVQLLRLGTLSDELQLVPLPDFKTNVWPSPGNYAWPEDPRGRFSVWSDSPAELREVSLLGL